jgi:hypothetical protein
MEPLRPCRTRAYWPSVIITLLRRMIEYNEYLQPKQEIVLDAGQLPDMRANGG